MALWRATYFGAEIPWYLVPDRSWPGYWQNVLDGPRWDQMGWASTLSNVIMGLTYGPDWSADPDLYDEWWSIDKSIWTSMKTPFVALQPTAAPWRFP